MMQGRTLIETLSSHLSAWSNPQEIAAFPRRGQLDRSPAFTWGVAYVCDTPILSAYSRPKSIHSKLRQAGSLNNSSVSLILSKNDHFLSAFLTKGTKQFKHFSLQQWDFIKQHALPKRKGRKALLQHLPCGSCVVSAYYN